MRPEAVSGAFAGDGLEPGGEVERPQPVISPDVDVGPPVDQELDDVQVIIPGGVVEDGRLLVVQHVQPPFDFEISRLANLLQDFFCSVGVSFSSQLFEK